MLVVGTGRSPTRKKKADWVIVLRCVLYQVLVESLLGIFRTDVSFRHCRATHKQKADSPSGRRCFTGPAIQTIPAFGGCRTTLFRLKLAEPFELIKCLDRFPSSYGGLTYHLAAGVLVQHTCFNDLSNQLVAASLRANARVQQGHVPMVYQMNGPFQTRA